VARLYTEPKMFDYVMEAFELPAWAQDGSMDVHGLSRAEQQEASRLVAAGRLKHDGAGILTPVETSSREGRPMWKAERDLRHWHQRCAEKDDQKMKDGGRLWFGWVPYGGGG